MMERNAETKSQIMKRFAEKNNIPIIDMSMSIGTKPSEFRGIPRTYCSECGKPNGHYIGCERSHN